MTAYEYLNDFSIQSEGYDGALVLRHSVCNEVLLPSFSPELETQDEYQIQVSVALLRISLHVCPGKK